MLEMIKFEDGSGDGDDVYENNENNKKNENENKKNDENDENNSNDSRNNEVSENNKINHRHTRNHRKVAVELFLSKIPTLMGACDCVRNGVFSSLHPQNIR